LGPTGRRFRQDIRRKFSDIGLANDYGTIVGELVLVHIVQRIREQVGENVREGIS
jgi:hypothetical protein